MRIVTQDRMKIIDTAGCDIIFDTDGAITLRHYTSERVYGITLGVYKTRQREREVFNLLIQAFGQIYRRDYFEMPAE